MEIEESFLRSAGCILAHTLRGWPPSLQGHTANSRFNLSIRTTIHRSVSAKCFLASQCGVCAAAYSVPGALRLSLLNIRRFLPVHSSSLWRSPQIASLPVGVSTAIPISCHSLSCSLCIPPHRPGEDTE